MSDKKLEAKIRLLKRRILAQDKKLDIADRIVKSIKDSIAIMPAIEAPTLFIPKTKHSSEVALILISDTHIGKQTISYNPKVFVKRLRFLEKSMMSIISALRSQRQIKKLVIVFNGDMVDCEAVYPAQAVDFMAIPIMEQIFSVGVPEFTKFILFCLKNFKEVEIHAIKGNHGRQHQAKWVSSRSTNWDLVFYKSLEATTRNQPRLKWHVEMKDWKAMFTILGHGFLATHGDMIRRYYNLPHYGMTRQCQRWQGAYRNRIKLDNFLFSHFHSANAGMRWNDLTIFVNGSWITDDEYAEEQLGVASVPEQLLLGIHPVYGVSFRHVIKLDLNKSSSK